MNNSTLAHTCTRKNGVEPPSKLIQTTPNAQCSLYYLAIVLHMTATADALSLPSAYTTHLKKTRMPKFLPVPVTFKNPYVYVTCYTKNAVRHFICSTSPPAPPENLPCKPFQSNQFRSGLPTSTSNTVPTMRPHLPPTIQRQKESSPERT